MLVRTSLEKALASQGRSKQPSVKYVDDLKTVVRNAPEGIFSMEALVGTVG